MARVAVAVVLILAASMIAIPARTLAQAQTADRPTWSAGDTWSYQQGSQTLTWTVLGPAGDGYSVESTAGTNAPTIVHFDHDLNFPGSIYFHPKWPMVPGDKWSYQVTSTATNGINGTNNYFTGNLAAVGWESVTVPAGTFMSLHIHGQSCNATQGNRCGDYDVWYSPQVKFTIKISWSGASYWNADIAGKSRVLTSYKVAP